MIKYIKRALSDIKHGNSIEVISALTTGINKHTILDSLYLYPYSKDYYSYILIDKRTKKIISFDCGDYKTSRFNIENLMHENNGSFEALFLTHEHKEHTEGSLD